MVTNEKVTINFCPTDHTSSNEPTIDGSKEEESTVLKEVLFLMEEFGVSDEFYHELSMILPTLPRSYKVKRLRKAIDDSVDIKRLPKPVFGAYRPLNDLLEALISDQVC